MQTSVAIGVLGAAIAAEVGATIILPRANGFRVPSWSIAVILGYAVSIWLLSVVVRALSVSTTYAVWAGVGTAAIAVIGVLFGGEHLDWISASALALIVAGVVLLNLHGGMR